MMMNTQFLFFLLLIPLVDSKFLIDWKECDGTYRECWRVSKSAGHLLAYTVPNTATETDDGIQFRPFNTKKWLVVMQTLDKELDPEYGLKMHYYRQPSNVPTILFGCYKPAGKGVEFIRDPALNINAYYAYSRFEGKTALCAFLISGDQLIGTTFFDMEPSLDYKLKAGGARETFRGTAELRKWNGFVNAKLSCDPDQIKVVSTRLAEGFAKRTILDNARMKFNCPAEHQLMVTPADGKSIEVTSLECDHTSKIYKYKLKKEGAEVRIQDASKAPIEFEAFCGLPISLSCVDFSPPVPSIAFRQFPSRIFCPKNQWFINANQYLVGEPFCGQRKVNPFDGGWFIEKKDKSLVEIKKAQCYEKIDCSIHSKLSYHCPLPKCEKYTQTKTAITCPANHLLRLVQPSSGRMLLLSQLICNGATGRWKGEEMPEEAENGANVFCELNCNAVSPLKEECPSDKQCIEILKNDQQIRCPASYSLRVDSTASVSPEGLTCDIVSGRWKMVDVEIEKGATVYCEEMSIEAASTDYLIASYAVASAVCVAVVAATAAFFIYLRWKNTGEAEEAMEEKRGAGVSTMAQSTETGGV